MIEFYGYTTHSYHKLENSIKKDIDILYNEACKLLKNRWVFMDNKKVFYDNEVVSLFPDLNYYICVFNNKEFDTVDDFRKEHVDKLNYENLEWDFMTLDENNKVFDKNIFYPFKSGEYSIIYDKYNNELDYIVSYEENKILKGKDIGDNSIDHNMCIVIPIYRLNTKNSNKLSNSKIFTLWIKNKLIPKESNYKELYRNLINLYENGFINNNSNLLEIIDFEKIKAIYKNFILKCDNIRAGIHTYDEKILTDVNRGHWEAKETEYVYRNPLKDVKEGIVGIDFGTKSTVVAYQDDTDYTTSMKIGCINSKKGFDEKQYENPTVMEFINLENFIKSYNESAGRPKTKWEDLTISHTAFESLLNSSSDDYYTYFSDLKHWCTNKTETIVIKDKTQKTFELKPFLSTSEGEVDLVEIYAYYLGLNINNMQNGIYLEYLLSFPVTYENEVKEKIVKSFEKGLKKSLPVEVLENEEVMNNFEVKIGANEPAAYAVTALTEYGFDPVDDEKVFYGVFDFGGGTTDFDFGIFREANQKGERRYDYVIEHFGASGDRYLGGENLLHLLAFEVFKDNKEELIKNNISFCMHPESKRFKGFESVTSISQEAKLNVKNLMEKLRPIWENHENYEKEFEKGFVNINMYKNDGNMQTNFELKVDLEKLQNILTNRIEQGVINFFESLRISFDNEKTADISKINIFLAGNSSKSEIVKELFEKYIQIETTNILGQQNKEIATDMEEDLFEVFPPLGTDEAIKKQNERNVEFDKCAERPTGKTGVAFGLVETREGGRIKVINHSNNQNKNQFNYYVGYNKKKKFIPVLTPQNDYNEWIQLIDAFEEKFEIYYTTSPKASTKTLEISETNRIKCKLEETFEDDETFVCVRAVSQSSIEFAVVKDNEVFSKVTKLELK